MPSLSAPRIFARVISMPPGMTVPSVASGTIMPAATLGAPQTMRSSAPPASTRQSLSLSAFGCFSAASTRATTMPGNARPCSSTPST